MASYGIQFDGRSSSFSDCPRTAYKYIATVKEHDVPIDQEDGHVALIIVLEVEEDEKALMEKHNSCAILMNEYQCIKLASSLGAMSHVLIVVFSVLEFSLMEAWCNFSRDLR
ncbi:hypothetical protein BYT27DRAFT_7336617 [Phlegmacium glaucopus]|nr:hypothetical protein BYT27DRAFT_7336617 [Phlegmacium glaucopus]